ncbi:MAG: lytic transglycosylase domain-containing protein [Burkholderiales bacterium]|nr:lytic transglycosylase domain-containing protein [Burkholderiales bacterium]
MLLARLLTIAALACALPAAAQPNAKRAKGPDPDEAILAAHAAWRAGDAARLARIAAALDGHPLAPYVEYWQLALRLSDAQPEDVGAFLARHAGSYLADRLRGEWLKELGRRGDWPRFERELGPLVQDDLEIRCYAWRARLARGDATVAAEAREIWEEPRDLPEACQLLAGELLRARLVDREAPWRRVRLLLANEQLQAARRAFAWLPAGEAPDERTFSIAATAPQRLIAQPTRDFARRAAREMALFALARFARADLEGAAAALGGDFGRRLPEADRRYGWGLVAHLAARRQHPQALDWYRRAEGAALTDDQLAWKARAALRALDWQAVRVAVDAMSAATRREPVWSYWYGRALAAQGATDGARAYFLRHAGEPHFYGILAAEELGYIPAPPEPFHVPAEEEVAAAARNPGLARALALYRLGLRGEAAREWAFSVRALADEELLAAAELARRHELYDRAINTAERTVHRHNFRLRYLAPFAETLRERGREYGLEEAWLLGLVRQESRFVVNARSSAGAQGLMQLMPATASWVARRIGLAGYHAGRVNEPETNIALGTRYLKFVLDELGHPVLALAAYNAGPGRARRWRDARPLEGAIYVETIPFKETRDYVKKVMANTMYYAQLYGGRVVPLKERLGTVPARNPAERVNEELP